MTALAIVEDEMPLELQLAVSQDLVVNAQTRFDLQSRASGGEKCWTPMSAKSEIRAERLAYRTNERRHDGSVSADPADHLEHDGKRLNH